MFQDNANTAQKVLESAWTFKDLIWKSINDILQSAVARLPYILAGLLVLLIFLLLAKLVRGIFWAASERTKLDQRLRILFSRLIVVSIFILGIFAAFTVIIPNFKFTDLIAGVGLTSFVIAFAAKDILNNLFSGVLILWQQPFRIGDYIFVGANQGKVEYIGVRATRLRKDDGEAVIIPNGDMYSSALTIRGAGAERRLLLKLNLAYDAEIAEAKQIINEVLSQTEGVVKEPKTSVVVTDLTAEGVNLAAYFWINTDKHSPLLVFDAAATGVKKALADRGIKIFAAPAAQPPAAPEKENLPVKKKEDF